MKTGSARRDIINAVRINLARSYLVERSEAPGYPMPEVGLSRVSAPTDPIEVFSESLKAVGGHVTIIRNASELSNALGSLIEEKNPRRIAISASALIDSALAYDHFKPEVLRSPMANELFDCDIGITEAQWGIAETGTLVLESELERSRLISLVPNVHVAILFAEKIRHTMGEILEILQHQLSPTVTFITGPSRTSDIELTLAIGVHGPTELHVIIIREE